MKKLNPILNSNNLYLFLILIIGIYVTVFINYPRKSILNIENNEYIGTINKINIDGNYLSLELIGKEKIIGTYYFKTELDKNNFNNNYKLGDKIKIIGIYTKPSNNTIPNSFNYKKYLERQKIYYVFKIEEIIKIKDNSNIYFTIKNNLINYISKYKTNNYLNIFILGNNNLINEDVLNSYRQNGISHLFSISGMHISLLSLIILIILKLFIKKEIYSYLITTILLFIFVLISGLSPSALRSFLLFLLLYLNKLFKLNISTIKVLLLTVFILLLINPFYIFNIGFIYSYTICFYLILFQNIYKDKNYFYKLLLISLISFIVSLPITIFNTNEINLLSILYNLILVPLVSIIIFPLSLISLIFPFIDDILLFFIKVLESLSLYFNSINSFKLIFPKPSILLIIIYYFLVTIFLYKRKYKSFLLIFLLTTSLYFKNNIIKRNEVLFFDVGQGDSILISTNNKNVLIDTGGSIKYKIEEWKVRKKEYSIALDKIIPLLKSLGIRKLDYLIISHGDFDHMGEAINLVENFKIDNVIFNCSEYNDLEKELIKVLDKKKIKYYSCIKELNIDKYKLQFLNTKEYDNENDNSNVIYFNYKSYEFLFMGDAGIEKEKDILDKYNLKDIDFLKVGHHGSNTSSSEYFIDSINPKYSLISVGKNNRYGHPKDDVLETLKNSKIYRTDLNGSIEIKLNRNGYKIRTCPP